MDARGGQHTDRQTESTVLYYTDTEKARLAGQYIVRITRKGLQTIDKDYQRHLVICS